MVRSRPLRVLLTVLVFLDFTTPNPLPGPHPCRWVLWALGLAPVGDSARQNPLHGPRIRPAGWPVVAAPIELQILMDHEQRHLQPHFRLLVWLRGTMQCVAELPIPLVEQIVGHYLSGAGLTASVLRLREPVETPVRRPLASAPDRSRPRAVGVPLLPVQEARRAARRANSAHRGPRRTRGPIQDRAP